MSDWRRVRGSTRVLGHLRRVIDAAYDRTLIEEKTGEKVACAKGCGHCCYQLVTVSMPEAVDLYINTAGIVRPKVLAWAQRYTELLMQGFVGREWFQRQVGCVFLSPRNNCTVYRARPFACRTLWALGSADNCAPDAADSSVKRVNYNGETGFLYSFLAAPAQSAGLPVGLVPLAVGIHWFSSGLKPRPSGRLWFV